MIEVLVGNIGSGKSTYAKQRSVLPGRGAVVVSEDAIIMAVHGGNYGCYQDRLKPLYKLIEQSIVTMAVALDRDVIIDKTNMTIAQRARWVSLARSLDMEVRCRWWKNFMPRTQAVDRRMAGDSRGLPRETWEKVWGRKDAEFEPPTDAEGFSNIIYMGN